MVGARKESSLPDCVCNMLMDMFDICLGNITKCCFYLGIWLGHCRLQIPKDSIVVPD